MKYVTDIHALNLPSDTDTTGDWHASALQWERLRMAESEESVFGDWGITCNSPVRIPEHEGVQFNVANHVRALLDMIEHGRLSIAQGMRDAYIGNDAYNDEIFPRVWLLHQSDNWPRIDHFMKKEYGRAWLRFVEEAQREVA
ncbi:hypothetical protein QEV69_04560 [Trueperella pyogenes]|uniref:hypothetical protein n=1 Tax=Trueperella pyogenes TaxID=1661 RepID=UPI003255CD4C